MSKKRVSLTLDENLVQRIDAEAESRSMNRSQMVERIIENYVSSQDIDTAAVFCGGESYEPLEEIEGKPLMSHILEILDNKGVKRVILLAGSNDKKLKNYFGRSWEGLELEYVSDAKKGGTATALKQLKEKIRKTFLAVNGDVIVDIDLRDMLKVHRDEGKKASMALTTVQNPANYGVVRIKGRTVLGFDEKPEPGEEPTKLINAGAYIFEPEIFNELEKGGLHKTFEKFANDKELTGYLYGGEWRKMK